MLRFLFPREIHVEKLWGVDRPSYDRNDGGAIGNGWIRVIHNDGASGGKRPVDQLVLTTLRLTVVTHGILAHVIVCAGKPVPVEGRLARRR